MEIDAAMLIQDNTTLLWIETPSNPTLFLVDIEAVAKVAHQRGVLVVVDNTFLSPYIQTPLKWGADIVLYSVTKYLNGHSVSTVAFILHTNEKYLNDLQFSRMFSWGRLLSILKNLKKSYHSSKTPLVAFPLPLTVGSHTVA